VAQQFAQRADGAVAGAPVEQRPARRAARAGRAAGGEVVDYQVGPARGDPLDHRPLQAPEAGARVAVTPG
jgi:hypothetical protein